MKHFSERPGAARGFCCGASLLALGLASAILVFAIAHALLLSPVDYRDPRTLIQLPERDAQGNLVSRRGMQPSVPVLVALGRMG
jgi:hypothetical protein